MTHCLNFPETCCEFITGREKGGWGGAADNQIKESRSLGRLAKRAKRLEGKRDEPQTFQGADAELQLLGTQTPSEAPN